MPAGSVEERAQRIRNLGAECTIMEVIIAVGIVVIFIIVLLNVTLISSVTIMEVIVTIVVFANIMNSSFRSTMMHVSISLAPLRKNQVTRCFIISLLTCLQYFALYHNIIIGGLLIMDTAVEEDTEEERKMPLAIMQGYMTIMQVGKAITKVCMVIIQGIMAIIQICKNGCISYTV